MGLSRNRIYHILELTDPEDRPSRLIGFAIVGLIIINVLAIVLESIPSIYEEYETAFFRLEIISCTHTPPRSANVNALIKPSSDNSSSEDW